MISFLVVADKFKKYFEEKIDKKEYDIEFKENFQDIVANIANKFMKTEMLSTLKNKLRIVMYAIEMAGEYYEIRKQTVKYLKEN